MLIAQNSIEEFVEVDPAILRFEAHLEDTFLKHHLILVRKTERCRNSFKKVLQIVLL